MLAASVNDLTYVPVGCLSHPPSLCSSRTGAAACRTPWVINLPGSQLHDNNVCSRRPALPQLSVMTGGDHAYRENKHRDVDATAIHPTITNYWSQKNRNRNRDVCRQNRSKSIVSWKVTIDPTLERSWVLRVRLTSWNKHEEMKYKQEVDSEDEEPNALLKTVTSNFQRQTLTTKFKCLRFISNLRLCRIEVK